MSITAWQTSVLPDVPERLVRFGRERVAAHVAVVEDSLGLRVEVRIGRKLLERIPIGARSDEGFAARLADALHRANEIAAAAVIEKLTP